MDSECLQHLLTEEERESFDRDGFMVVENALPNSMVKDLNRAVDRIEGAVDFIGKDDIFLELIDWPTVFPKVFGILGWNIHIYHTVALSRSPDTEEKRRQKARLPWHQDSDRVNADVAPGPTMRISLKVGYLLTDLTKKGRGNQLFIPGSHLKRELDWPADGVSNPKGVYTLQAPAGSAVLFEQRIWHTGSPNLSNKTRKTLYYGYSYRWFHPRDERTVSHYMERSDPIRRQLLGAKTKSLGLTSPQPEDVPLRTWMEEHLGEEAVVDKYTRLVGGLSVSFARNPDDHFAVHV